MVPAVSTTPSFWHESLIASGEDDLRPRPGLDGDLDVDVCIIGAGRTDAHG